LLADAPADVGQAQLLRESVGVVEAWSYDYMNKADELGGAIACELSSRNAIAWRATVWCQAGAVVVVVMAGQQEQMRYRDWARR
jgi:hypothetical protein